MILANTAQNGDELSDDSHLIPSSMVGKDAGDKIHNNIKSVTLPTALIDLRGTVIGPSPSAPRVVAFSSHGPNYRAPEILKPDIIAPGVNIFATWIGASSPTDLDIDMRRVKFNISSGTYMACPHVSGVAALLKSAKLTWTPAAIKSAIMTTTYNLLTPGLHPGHGVPRHGTPSRSGVDDYIAFLCSTGYKSYQISLFTRDGSSSNCLAVALARPGYLNYPAFSVVFSSYTDVVTYHRTVINEASSVTLELLFMRQMCRIWWSEHKGDSKQTRVQFSRSELELQNHILRGR